MVDKKPILVNFDKQMEEIRKRHRGTSGNTLGRLRESVRNRLSGRKSK
ncbi:hypothetical protein LCGC14_1201760 [marine sediment metagenome]|uniref:Uncharacterized protein n=1 Tax=marine sediment metagenome TaxID=412755 RepID=A0A0F9NZ29_9ZZZZ